MMIPFFRNARADWSLTGDAGRHAVLPMLLLNPPTSQIIAGYFLLLVTGKLKYADRYPTDDL